MSSQLGLGMFLASIPGLLFVIVAGIAGLAGMEIIAPGRIPVLAGVFGALWVGGIALVGGSE